MGAYFLRASGAGIWGAPNGCRAYPLMAAYYPEREDSPAAMEGTAAHWAAEQMLDAGTRGLNPPDLLGKTASNGVVIDQTMLDAAALYADDFRAACIKHGVFGGDGLGIEAGLSMPQIHPQNGGTCDAFLFDRRQRKITVWDFKYGFRPVEAFENWQGLDYLAGIVHKLGLTGVDDPHYMAEIRIVQPRAFGRAPVQSWEFRLSDARPYFNDLAQGAAECFQENPPARVGRHCQHCSGRHACGALRLAASDAVAYSQGADFRERSPDAVAVELHWLDQAARVIEARRTGLAEQAEHAIRGGTPIPGYTLAPGRGSTEWTIPPEQVIRLGQSLGVDLDKKKPLTPTQAKAAGLSEDVINQFSERREGALRLTPDPKNQAKKVFSK